MARRISLREFQTRLVERLTSARRGETAQALLGVVSGKEHCLLDLSDSGEVLPLPQLTAVPLTKSWFAGVANVRGALYSVVDFSAFRGGDATPRNNDARLLLIGARHGVNSALLINRTLGLKDLSQLTEEPLPADAPTWAGARYRDADGQSWTRLRVRSLLENSDFLNVAA
jgi:twitching motility protein PilI